MKIRRILLLSIFCVSSLHGFSQQQNNNLSKLGLDERMEKMKWAEFSTIGKPSSSEAPQPKSNIGNNVFIQQVGSNNVLETMVISEKSNLSIDQNGNQNTILVDVTSKSTIGNITQTGNQNYSFDFVHDPTQEINLDLTQNGNGHHFERYGSNSIGNNLKFEMTGESQTIIVRNFK